MKVLACAAATLWLVTPVAAAAAGNSLAEAGRRLYREGILASGEPLRGVRPGGQVVTGRDAACVLCHQRSGLGMPEGAVAMPPISGPALFENRTPEGAVARRAPGMQLRDYSYRTRRPYDDASLARAIRQGVNPEGESFQYLMPRYDLPDPDMQALVAYLHTLSARDSPGVEGGIVHFATVVAPDAAPARRDEFLGVLQRCFADHGDWRLHVWNLEGAPPTWEKQLDERYASQPVFALVSGLGGNEWEPVERFCGANAVPCLFPNVERPGTPQPNWYSFYFYRGVALEAAVIAQWLKEEREARGIRRVVQVVPARGAGADAAAALRRELADSGMAIEDREAAASAGEHDALVLWLERDALAAYMKRNPAPPGAAVVMVSGLLAGLEDAPLPPGWKQVALMTYPFDPPARRQLRMERNLRPWLAEHGLAPGDERLQGNTLAACNVLSETMLRLRGRYVRDHLVEWMENYPSAMGNAPAPQAFPRFSLGPGQRFSSKGAYVVRFASADGKRLAPARDEWIVP
jgi:cytochrome c